MREHATFGSNFIQGKIQGMLQQVFTYGTTHEGGYIYKLHRGKMYDIMASIVVLLPTKSIAL